jgi:serine/threonine protein kinase
MIEHSSYNKMVGSTLANYRLEQLIERNKMGPVFLARSISTSPQPLGCDQSGPYAQHTTTMYRVRVLDVAADLTAEERIIYLGRFQQEANQVAALQHPAILPLLDYGNYQGMPYLVMPHMPTMRSLHDQLAQYGPSNFILASRCIDQIAAALEYAHQRAVLHRNLTANSIFIETTALSHMPKLIIADFGVLRMLELSKQDGQRSFLTYGSSEVSTPEQLLGNPVDASIDIYALGATLYRMLTGHRVFTAYTQEEIVAQHLHASVPSLTIWRKDLPTNLDSIVSTAMAKEPVKRFRRPTALANAYHEVVAPNDTARPPLSVTPPSVGTRFIASHGEARERAQSDPYARPARQKQISRRRVLFYIVAGGGAAAAVTTVALFGNYFLSGRSTSSTIATSANTPVANTGGSTSTTTSNQQPQQTPQTHTTTILAHTSDIPPNSAKTFAIANSANPGLLIHLSDNNFVAFNSTCTHAGCAVHYNAQDKLLECPCHGASFDPAKKAAVVQGPAQTPLAPINITVNTDGTITKAI